MCDTTSHHPSPAVDHGRSCFDRHPRKTVLAVYLIVLAGFLALDFVVSTIRKSTLEIALYERMEPMGHVARSNFSGYFGVRFWDEFKSPVAFNNLGFRNDLPFVPETTAGRKVVVALGDSTTACLEVPVMQSYPAVLERELGTNVVVFNAGTRAYDTQQVILNYLTRIRPLRPSAVVYLICPNDYNNNVEVEAKSDYIRYYGKGLINDRHETEYVQPVIRSLPGSERFRILFKTNFNLTSCVANRIAQVAGRFASGQPGSAQWGTAHYCTPATMRKMEQLLAFFDKETARDGVVLFLAFMPEFEKPPQVARKTEMYLAYVGTRDFVGSNLTNTVFIPTFDIYLDKYAAQPGRPRFTFKRDPHANEYGNRWLGEVIGSYMRTNAVFSMPVGANEH